MRLKVKQEMKFFNKEEILVVGSIFVFIVLISFPNFKLSLKRGRDAQRKDDLGTLVNSLASYQSDLGSYPLSSSDGKILACRPKESLDTKGKKIFIYEACEWGKDGLADALEPSYPSYVTSLPSDPSSSAGLTFLYLSNGKRFQIFAHLEAKDDDEYNFAVEARQLSCGNKLCNFGKASGDTPLEKSIEEYENELLEKTQKLQNSK